MTAVTLQEAMNLTEAGIAKATEMGVAMNIAVVDEAVICFISRV